MLIPKMPNAVSASTSKQGFLRSLKEDTRGNTLAIMTAAMVPLAGVVGGALDMSRLYLVQTRAQQACDAGALAGRKRMGGGQWSQAGGAPNTAALNFFDANFADGSYGTDGRTRAFTENAGRVTGTASVNVPMTLMRIFGHNSKQVQVTCDAEMRLPNTDVMFVLDTTGSMAAKAVSTDTQTKIVALKSAVKCFYEIVARIDTSEPCATGTPTGGTAGTTQVRFGFVPYATNVNVGRLLPSTYFADSWPYQSRVAVTKTETFQVPTGTTTTWTNGAPSMISESWTRGTPGAWATYSGSVTTNVRQNQCSAPADDAPTDTGTVSGRIGETTTMSGTTRTTTWRTEQAARYEYEYDVAWVGTGGNRGTCTIRRRTTPATHVRNYQQSDTSTVTTTFETRTRQVFDYWRYAKIDVDIRGLKNGTAWNASFLRPIGNTNDGAEIINNKTIRWDGCIEERKTIRATSYTSETGGAAKDLDIDTAPTSSDPESLWGPALHDLIYLRPSTNADINDANDLTTFNLADNNSETNYSHIDGNGSDSYFCPAEARKLQTWSTASGFESYVDGLSVSGNTYHDIGLIWGARFLSPTGIFSSENARTPLGADIERHLIFMTDGETCTASFNYGAYGFPWYDRRQTPVNTALNTNGTHFGCETETSTGGTLSEQVNARYAAVCTAVKNKNITLWVIWFGASKPNLETRLRSCATPSRFHTARNSADLQTTFASIANQISQLRLTN